MLLYFSMWVLFCYVFHHIGPFLLFFFYVCCLFLGLGAPPPLRKFLRAPISGVSRISFRGGGGGSTYCFEKWGNCMARKISKKSRLYKFNNFCRLTCAWQYFGTLIFELFFEIIRSYVNKIFYFYADNLKVSTIVSIHFFSLVGTLAWHYRHRYREGCV